MKTIQQNTLLPETASSSAIEDFVTEVTVMRSVLRPVCAPGPGRWCRWRAPSRHTKSVSHAFFFPTHSHLQHRNVIQLIGACLPPHPLCIVVELLEKGDLDAILEDKSEVVDRASEWKTGVENMREHTLTKLFVFKGLLRFALDIAQGMDCLHAAKIIHSDLKPSNVLVSADDVCKVSNKDTFELDIIMAAVS